MHCRPRNHVKFQQVMPSIEASVFRIKHIVCIHLCKVLGSRGGYLLHSRHVQREGYVSYR